jgi:5'-nucleotidase (lipoprotein e(P4) family)
MRRTSLVLIGMTLALAPPALARDVKPQPAARGAAKAVPCASCPHERLHAVLWMQHAAEYQAAALQAFTLARVDLDRALQQPESWVPAYPSDNPEATTGGAIIVDLDETVLENAREEGTQVALGLHTFDTDIWRAWVRRAESGPLAGAVDLLTYAASRGVRTYYVTNRSDVAGLPYVKQNLVRIGFPVPDDDVLLVVGAAGTSGSDKESRRKLVAARHRVLLMIGDDLGDFFSVSGLSQEARAEATMKARSRWGWQWIVVPNPSYGSWERVFSAPGDKEDVILRKKRDALRCIENPCPEPAGPTKR